MQYGKIHPARFLARPNRFVARVEMEQQEVICHVKNTGRCRELLVPGATVWLEEGTNPNRKTAYDLIAVEKGDRLINMDSQAPNKVFEEWAGAGHFQPGLTKLRREITYGSSRFDFYWESSEKRGFVEVKGVTLEEDGVVQNTDQLDGCAYALKLYGADGGLLQSLEGTIPQTVHRTWLS